jgi:hypothetical protein
MRDGPVLRAILIKGAFMLKPVRFTLAALVLFGCALAASRIGTAQAAPGGAAEYAVIQWDGERKTQVIWPDGRVELLSSLLPGVSPPDGAHQRGYIMTLLINKLAKEGYDYVGMADGEEIVMKKVR